MRQLTPDEKQRICGLLADLVGIDSAVTSDEQANRDRTEEKIADYLTGHLKRMGMVVDWQEVHPGRPNLIAHWPDQGGDTSLMLEAHLDTVTVEGMTVNPFAAEVHDGRMFGRGTCDTKGSMAAFLTALDLARKAGKLPADKLYFVASMSEEMGCDGATALMANGFRTDAAIVGEPTSCRLVTAHKGPVWFEIETHGKACHASTPDKGVNAIELMSRIVQFIHGPWSAHLARATHPLLGHSTAAVTGIEGGAKMNIIPARCRAEIDARLIPGRPLNEVIEELERMLADELGEDASFELREVKKFEALDCPIELPLVTKLLGLCQEASGQASPMGVNYFADTGPFSKAGIDAVLFGPGDIAQAHTADEYIELDQLYRATEIVLELLTSHSGQSIVK